jgi:hypothetical protein
MLFALHIMLELHIIHAADFERASRRVYERLAFVWLLSE